MSAMQIALGVLLILASIAIIIVVLLQDANQGGLSGAIAGGGDTFFAKNKGRTKEAKLKKVTMYISIFFLVLTLAAVLLLLFFD